MIYYKIQQWNLEDLLNETPYEETPTGLATLLTQAGVVYTATDLEKELWTRVFNKFSKCVVFETENDTPDLDIIEEEAYRFFVKFVNKILDTKEYYETLIGIYNSNLANLMGQVGATTTNEVIFNDTPQTTSGVLSGDTYATTYTKTTSTSLSDMKTLIERIKDIQDSLRNIWADWVAEFRHIFLED